MLRIAKILKSDGTDGDLLVAAPDVDLEEIDTEEPVFIEFDGLAVPFFIESCRPKGRDRAVVHLSDVDSLADAEELCGRPICIDAEQEDSDEEDFTGWDIYDKGRFVGVATGTEQFPGHLCVTIGDVLLPLHEDLVLECDPDARKLVLDIPDGLLGK